MPQVDFSEVVRPKATRDESDQIRLCRNGVIISPAIHLVGVQFQNIDYFLIYIFSLCALSIFVFICEILFCHLAR